MNGKHMRMLVGCVSCVAGVAGSVFGQAVQWRVEDGGNGHWYETLDVNLPTWEQARDYAVARGGHLVTMSSEQERAFIASSVGWNGPPGTLGYLGLFQDHSASDYSEPAGGWRWVTGDQLAWWPFANGFPNNQGGGQDYGINYGDFWVDDWSPGTCCTPVKLTIEWDADCNSDGVVDKGQILSGQLMDANHDGVPDVCECNNWTLTAPSSMPPVRQHFGLAFDEARRQSVIFGGLAYPNGTGPIDHEYGDTWVSSGSGWSQHVGPGPSMRSVPAMAYDTARQRVVLFGGSFASGETSRDFYNDTWEWDGNSWTLVATTGPSGRSGAAMAYDPLRGRVVLAGGTFYDFSGGGWTSLADCWEWDGAHWTPSTPLPSPIAYSRMARDNSRQRLVMFSGTCGQYCGFNSQTFERAGETWTAINASGPAARANHMMTYVPELDGVMLYGGTVGNPDGELGDTWLWNGATWRQLSPATAPSRREAGGLVYDSYRHRTLLMFGYLVNTQSYLNEQWEFGTTTTSFSQQPVNAILLPGQTAHFGIVATNSTGYQWRRNGNNLNDSARVSGASTDSLTITSMQSGDQGFYDCVVSGNCGNITSETAELSCRAAITQQPVGGAYLGGDSIVLSAAVNSAGTTTYRWKKDGVNLFNGVIFSGSTTTTLTINASDPSQSGSYALTIANTCGTSTTLPAVVTVTCSSDINNDGSVDFFDYLDFVDAFSGNLSTADFNGDGTIDFFDYLDFVDRFSIGC